MTAIVNNARPAHGDDADDDVYIHYDHDDRAGPTPATTIAADVAVVMRYEARRQQAVRQEASGAGAERIVSMAPARYLRSRANLIAAIANPCPHAGPVGAPMEAAIFPDDSIACRIGDRDWSAVAPDDPRYAPLLTELRRERAAGAVWTPREAEANILQQPIFFSVDELVKRVRSSLAEDPDLAPVGR